MVPLVCMPSIPSAVLNAPATTLDQSQTTVTLSLGLVNANPGWAGLSVTDASRDISDFLMLGVSRVPATRRELCQVFDPLPLGSVRAETM